MNHFKKQNEANLKVFLSCWVRGKGGRDQVEIKAGGDYGKSSEENGCQWAPQGRNGMDILVRLASLGPQNS